MSTANASVGWDVREGEGRLALDAAAAAVQPHVDAALDGAHPDDPG